MRSRGPWSAIATICVPGNPTAPPRTSPPRGRPPGWPPHPLTRRWHFTEGSCVIGEFTLSGIALGPFRSANLGYWIDEAYTGRGLATRAVEEVCRAAREDLGLHRVQAGALIANAASQRVLIKCSFELIGMASRYLHIDGAWRDHRLFQRILHDDPPMP
ncbi:GNAT family N-acetyltransferase [Streptomyces sp. NPDC001820]|uniref:GNAT family N-acetyltransferase n=1 Tax=Streptomyces sp. NPDC001820 TaxID=3364613 RepID=UPI0036AE5FEA